MEIKTHSSEITTIGHLSAPQSTTLIESDNDSFPIVTKGDNDLGEYGKVVIVRGSEIQKTITVPLDPQKEERRYKNLVENRGAIEIDSTGSAL